MSSQQFYKKTAILPQVHLTYLESMTLSWKLKKLQRKK